MQKVIHDTETGEIVTSDLTQDEIAEIETMRSFEANLQAEAAEKAARRAEILERLGLTEDEAKLILG